MPNLPCAKTPRHIRKIQLHENIYRPQFDFKFHSDRLEKLEFEKKQRSNSGLFRVVLTKKSCFSMRKYA